MLKTVSCKQTTSYKGQMFNPSTVALCQILGCSGCSTEQNTTTIFHDGKVWRHLAGAVGMLWDFLLALIPLYLAPRPCKDAFNSALKTPWTTLIVSGRDGLVDVVGITQRRRKEQLNVYWSSLIARHFKTIVWKRQCEFSLRTRLSFYFSFS